MTYRTNKNALSRWKWKNRRARKYVHFDERLGLKEVWHYISNPENIEKHSFYPFIFFKMIQTKYVVDENSKTASKKRIKKCKPRDIYYSAHTDRYVYSYYGHLLNQIYNQRVDADYTDNASIAYRDNKEGMNNIHSARKAYDFIRKQDSCFVIIGDFNNFFDNLEHSYLKERWLDLLDLLRN